MNTPNKPIHEIRLGRDSQHLRRAGQAKEHDDEQRRTEEPERPT